MSSQMRILVVGAGWYGCHLAKVLLEKGEDVQLVDAQPTIFAGASFYNQNRLHLGFHYPRCSKTRDQSKRGFHQFKKVYGELCTPLKYNLYAIRENQSFIDFKTYTQIMASSGLSFEDVTNVSPIFLENIEGIIDTSEEFICPIRSKKYFQEKLGGIFTGDVSISQHRLASFQEKYDWVLDCTWGGLVNQVNAFFESCLYFAYESKSFRDYALTIMDGGFYSIYPYIDDLHTVTGVNHIVISTHNDQSDAYRATRKILGDNTAISARRAQLESSVMDSFPGFLERFKFAYPVVSVKAKFPSGMDSRYIKVLRKDNVLEVFSGKIDTIFDAESLVMKELYS